MPYIPESISFPVSHHFREHRIYESPLLSPLFNTSLRDAWVPALMSVSVTYAHWLTNFSTSRDGIWAEHERGKQGIPSLDGFLGFYVCVHAQILPKKNRMEVPDDSEYPNLIASTLASQHTLAFPNCPTGFFIIDYLSQCHREKHVYECTLFSLRL